jgi:SPP1 family predicted phage head-tail adaptor
VRGGKLDRRITIQSKAEVTDSYGQRTVTWSTHLTVWSDPIQEMGKEKTDNNNRGTERKVNFRS